MRRCDLCKKNEAVLSVSRLDKNGKKTELWVCAECAQERGFVKAEVLKASVAEVLAELKERVEEQDSRLVCAGCGMTYAEFKRRGRLGCAQCWTAFHDRLQPLLRRIHGAVQHVGRTTKAGRKKAQERLNLQRLREDLRRAIEGEDYERAAALRDQLRQLGDETDNGEGRNLA
ncbi:MAG: UvrB/UvrC motif-containing protein [candidate division WOR-3 bacterium]